MHILFVTFFNLFAFYLQVDAVGPLLSTPSADDFIIVTD